MQASVPVALWQYTADPGDQARLDALRAASGYDWTAVRPFRDKEEAGHEEPWYAYLRGDNPDYPAAILGAAHAQARRRLALMEQHAGQEVAEPDIHLWQNLNPVVTEALTQLTWGAPQVVYNGGLTQARVRYYDAAAAPAGAAAGCGRAGQLDRPGGDHGDPGQPVRRRGPHGGGAGRRVRRARHRDRGIHVRCGGVGRAAHRIHQP